MFLPLRGKFISELSRLTEFFIFFLFLAFRLVAQPFDPPADQAGSLAIPQNSSAIKLWASGIAEVKRGFKNIADTASGKVSNGSAENALGPALQSGVFSLGDGGFVTLRFPAPLIDASGPDLAVFENAFSDEFLELALVEVSSNGTDFYAFPARSETSASVQKGPFDTLNARNLYNLAGKYRAGFGTGFDLAELAGRPGLDVQDIRFVRVRDVVGSIMPQFSSLDALGNIINDPWPTAFESGGFDLDAVAALHIREDRAPLVWPNVLSREDGFAYHSGSSEDLLLYNSNGRLMATYPSGNGSSARLPSGILPGLYFMRSRDNPASRKILVR